MDFIAVLESCLGRKARKEFLPMQPGDVYETYADVRDLMEDFGFKPSTTIEEGLKKFADWFLDYYRTGENSRCPDSTRNDLRAQV